MLLGTSKRTPFARTVLGHFGLSDRFSGIYGSEPHGRLDAKPALIRHFLGELGIDPAEAVVVGDREDDVIGAHSNGVAVVGVTYGYGTRQELRAAGAFLLCDDPRRLLELL